MMASQKNTIVEFVNTTCQDTELAPLTKFIAIKQKLLELKVARIDVLHVSDVLCHRSNRGGTGINPYNAHKQLTRVHKAGPNISLLNQACCVEMHPVTHPQRQKDIDFNKELVLNAKGMLADVTGSERVLSLSTGHTTSGCRAANAGCKTSYEAIADAAGNINASMLKNASKDMTMMLEVGWEWFIVPYWLPDECPEFCHLCQSALNAANTIHSVTGEVETGLQLVEELQFCGNDWNAAVNACEATEPPCKDYIRNVAKYVQDFCGKQSEGYPIIKFLAGFAQNVGVSVLLGQQFTYAIATLEFPKSLKQYEFIRCACIATNLTSSGSKVKDNIGKILSTTDVNSLKAKDKLPKVEKTEAALKKAWEIVEELQASKAISDSQAFGLFGRYCFRMVLKLFEKEKWGLDTTVYKTYEDIEKIFNQEKDMAINSKLVSSAAASPSAASAAVTAAVEDGPVAVAKRKFNMVQGTYYENKKQHANKHFKLTSITSDGATFQQLSILDEKPDELKVPLEFEHLKTWKQMSSSFKPSELLNVKHTFFAESSDFETAKAQSWLQLKQLYDETVPEEGSLKFVIFPFQVLAGRDFAKGELKLVPMPETVSKLCSAGGARVDDSAATCTLNGHKLLITPPSKQPFLKYMAGELSKEKLEKDKPLLAAYWWVKEVDAIKLAEATKDIKTETPNMKFENSGKPTFTRILVNSKAIKKNEVLQVSIQKRKA